MSVDTLTLAKELRAADIAVPQAEAIAAATGRAVVETSATKADVVQLGTELRGEIGRLGSDLRVEIERSRNQLIMWFVATQLALGGLVVAAIKLIPTQVV